MAPSQKAESSRRNGTGPKNGIGEKPLAQVNFHSRNGLKDLAHTRPKGTVIIIGGREDKEEDKEILQEVVRRADKGRVLLVTAATELPKELAEVYTKVFKQLGVKQIDVLDTRTREDAFKPENVELMKKAGLVYFTGGDQLRITSQIGDSLVYRHMINFYIEGGTLVGTSAGAAAMSETMLFYGPSDESNRISSLGMSPGFGVLKQIVIDTHFAERGRMGRLLGAVSQNPKNLGLGIDENTAVIIEKEKHCSIMGSGAVYFVDGSGITYTSLTEKQPEGVTTIHDVKVHVLGNGDKYDLEERRPVLSAAQASGA
jgi:cyanophycinase